MAPQATVTLKAIDEATATMNKVAREFNGVQNSIERFAVSAQRLVVGGAIVSGMIAAFRGMVDSGLAYGKELDNMARKTGQSIHIDCTTMQAYSPALV